jgi:integrase
MHDLEKRDVSDFRDQMLGSFTRTTANHDLKIVKMIFRDALDDGVIPENPVNGVKSVRLVKENAGRRAFTSNEIKLILGEANTEWKGMILMGLYTGQRLKDVAQIKWVNIDLENKMIIFQSSKTQRNQRIPIAEPLLEYLITLKPQGESELAIFPKASHAIVSHSTGGTSTLSNQFYEIMAKAGLVPKRSKKATGKGHSGKRNQNQISFHALRHTTTSLLKNAGVAASVVQDLVGHESSAMSNHYTHVDDEAKIQALDKLPRY